MGRTRMSLIAAFLGSLLAVWGILGTGIWGSQTEQYIELADYKGISISRESILASEEMVQNQVKAYPPEYSEEEKEEIVTQIRNELEKKNLMELVWKRVREETVILGYPDDRMEECMDAYMAYFDELFQELGGDMKTFLAMQNLTEQDFERKLERVVKEDVAELMIIEAIARLEKLTIGENEYQEGLKALADDFGVDAGELEAKKEKKLVTRTLLRNKVLDYLANHAVVSSS